MQCVCRILYVCVCAILIDCCGVGGREPREGRGVGVCVGEGGVPVADGALQSVSASASLSPSLSLSVCLSLSLLTNSSLCQLPSDVGGEPSAERQAVVCRGTVPWPRILIIRLRDRPQDGAPAVTGAHTRTRTRTFPRSLQLPLPPSLSACKL